jgi:C-terminal processing protease CtpA/Prc
MLTVVILSCGGGTSNNTPPVSSIPGSNDSQWLAGQFLNEANFKDRCATPRVGPDSNGDTFADVQGSNMHEKMWLRSWTNDSYLWFDEVPDNDPNPFSVANYFAQLKTSETTPSGSLKDNFHFSQSTEEYNQRTQSGVASGYGISWEFVNNSAPRQLVVRYTEPGSPANLAGVKRGYQVKTIDAIDFVNTVQAAEIAQLNDALFPTSVSNSTLFGFVDMTGNDVPPITITSGNIALQPVQNVRVIDTDLGRVGYMQFNSHIRAAQDGLINGFQQFVDANVTELVLDMRYNGGGLLAMASQVAYMIAGSAQTNNQIFETTQFNTKYPTTDPVNGNPLQPTPFYNREIDWDNNRFTDKALPSLALTRVFILSTDGTCSASEAVINSLKGIDIEVVLIGDTTCGKPYGFYPADNCSTTYFSIQFQGVNAKNFGDYALGFTPTVSPQFQDQLPGCFVEDDFGQALGDSNEALLSAALSFATTGVCPVVAKTSSKKQQKNIGVPGPAIRSPNTILDSIILENKIWTPVIEPSAL